MFLIVVFIVYYNIPVYTVNNTVFDDVTNNLKLHMIEWSIGSRRSTETICRHRLRSFGSRKIKCTGSNLPVDAFHIVLLSSSSPPRISSRIFVDTSACACFRSVR
jgi:hypothetical protein